MLPALLAELGSIERTVVTVLAVAGGFLAGYVGTGVLAYFIGKFTMKQSPGRLVHFVKLAGGAAAAIAVYLLLSGEGGLGFGGAGGGNSRKQNDGKSDTRIEPIKDTPNEEPKKIDVKRKDEDLRGTPLSVYVLGVDAVDNRYFRFEDQPQPLTDAEIVQRIEDFEKAGKLKNKQIRLKAGSENMSVPQYAKIYSRLRAEFEPRGFEIIPLKSESTSP
jgi:hypothetical protein